MKRMIAFATCIWLLAGCTSINEDINRTRENIDDTRNDIDEMGEDIQEGINDVFEDSNFKSKEASAASSYDIALSTVPSYCNAVMGTLKDPNANF